MANAKAASHFGRVMTDLSGPGGKLYGRDKEKKTIQDVWKRCYQDKEQELVVIDGRAGLGKAALASSLKPIIQKDKNLVAFFVKAQFTESTFIREPYEVFISVVTSFVDQLFETKKAEVIEMCKVEVQKAMGDDERTLTHLIPALKRMVSSQPPNELERKRNDSSHRIRLAFSRLISAITRVTPLTIFFNDMQWADTGSLELINTIMHANYMPLLIIGAVLIDDKDDEDTYATFLSFRGGKNKGKLKRPFFATLSSMERENKIRITKMELTQLGVEHIAALLADVFSRDISDALVLAEVLYPETGGNIFRLFLLLRRLVTVGIVQFKANEWMWDTSEIKEGLSDTAGATVIELIVLALECLPRTGQEALKIASCLGNEIDDTAIALVLQTTASQYLQQAAEEGLVIFYPEYGGYRFAHSWIRRAAYSMIPEAERAEFNLKLARRLWRASNAAALDSNSLLVASLMNRGAKAMTERKERLKAAELNLKAGRKALAAAAFVDAAFHLRHGISFLPKDCWSENYQLAVDLYSYTAEAEVVNGNFAIVAPCIQAIIRHGTDLRDKVRSYAALVESMMQQDDMREATVVCCDVLKQLGESMPAKVSRVSVGRELIRVKALLKKKSTDDILSLQKMKSRTNIDCMTFLNLGFISAYRCRSELAPLFALRGVLMTLKHGIQSVSAVAFAGFAAMLCGEHIDVHEGYRIGQLALSIAEKMKDTQTRALTSFLVGIGTIHWTRPLKESSELLSHSVRLGLESGHVGHALYARIAEASNSRFAGQKLYLIKKELVEDSRLARIFGQMSSERPLSTLLQLLYCYEDLSENPSRVSGSCVDFEDAVHHAIDNHDHVAALSMYLAGTEAAVIHGDMEHAREMAGRYKAINPQPTFAAYSDPVFRFFDCLINIWLANRNIAKKKNLREARKLLKQFSEWASDSPSSFLHMEKLLTAELLTFDKKAEIAYIRQSYFDAMACAREVDNLMIMALACEKLGDFLATKMQESNALVQWNKAADFFEEWGAKAKCRMLRALIDSKS